jgi:hypothetical protein
MKTYHNFLLSTALLVLFLPTSFAQKSKTKTDKNTVAKATITTTTKSVATVTAGLDPQFKPVLENSERILVVPSLDAPQTDKQPVVFLQTEAPASLNGEYTPLPSADILTEFPASDQLGYFRIGVGNHRSFLGDMQLNLLRKPNHFIDVNIRHRSIFGDVLLQTNAVQQAYYADNDLQMNYKAFFGKTLLEANLGEHVQFWNNYGARESYGMDTLILPKGQWNTDGHYGFRLTSMDLNEPTSWDIKTSGHLFRLGNGVSSSLNIPVDPKGGTEHEFCLDGTVKYKLNERFQVGVEAQIRNFSYDVPKSFSMNELNPNTYRDLSTEFADRNYFNLRPTAQYYFKNWRFTGGLNLSIPSLVTESVKPNLLASAITSINKTLVFNLILDGGVKPNSYREGFNQNPFLDPSIRLRAEWKPYDLRTSLDFRPIPNLKISPEVGFSTTLDAPFFYNCLPIASGINNSNGHYFGVEYMTSSEMHIELNGNYSVGAVWTLFGSIRYNQYVNKSDNASIDAFLDNTGRKAWYKPGLVAHIRTELNPIEKLAVFADYRFEGLRYAPIRIDQLSGTQSEFNRLLESVSNLSLGANYNVSKGVGIFVHINNLLDQRYEGYYGYPVHGFTAIVGGSVSF